jgi:hypothetical protein
LSVVGEDVLQKRSEAVPDQAQVAEKVSGMLTSQSEPARTQWFASGMMAKYCVALFENVARTNKSSTASPAFMIDASNFTECGNAIQNVTGRSAFASGFWMMARSFLIRCSDDRLGSVRLADASRTTSTGRFAVGNSRIPGITAKSLALHNLDSRKPNR